MDQNGALNADDDQEEDDEGKYIFEAANESF
jgi:hypothetical protein